MAREEDNAPRSFRSGFQLVRLIKRIGTRRVHATVLQALRRLRGLFASDNLDPTSTCPSLHLRRCGQPSTNDAQLRNRADSSPRCPSADRSSSLAPSNIPLYSPPHLPLDILYLILNFCSASYLLACRLVCPQPRCHNVLHTLTMADNRCAGPLTTSSPTASSWCTKPLSSTNTGSTSVLPPGPQQALPSP